MTQPLMCPICKQVLAGIVETITAVSTGGSHKGHFWCVYPQGPKVPIVVSPEDWQVINQWGSERIQHFRVE